MTESTSTKPEPVRTTGSAARPLYEQDHRDRRLYRAAAWVAIVAGILFIVGAVFFTGFALGRHSGYGGWGHHMRVDRMGPPMMPMMDRDDDRGPGMRGPDTDTPVPPPQR